MNLRYKTIYVTPFFWGLLFGLQNLKAQTPNWQNTDLNADGVFGISTEKAYSELLKNKKTTVGYCCCY